MVEGGEGGDVDRRVPVVATQWGLRSDNGCWFR